MHEEGEGNGRNGGRSEERRRRGWGLTPEMDLFLSGCTVHREVVRGRRRKEGGREDIHITWVFCTGIGNVEDVEEDIRV